MEERSLLRYVRDAGIGEGRVVEDKDRLLSREERTSSTWTRDGDELQGEMHLTFLFA